MPPAERKERGDDQEVRFSAAGDRARQDLRVTSNAREITAAWRLAPPDNNGSQTGGKGNRACFVVFGATKGRRAPAELTAKRDSAS
jgi:hypothetical protein